MNPSEASALLTNRSRKRETFASMRSAIIFLQAEAPPKPLAGSPCNGCGLCCTVAPCPIGVLLSRRRTGACRALDWNAATRQYRCGVIVQPRRWLPFLPTALGRRLARRWIAASQGCDSDLEVD